MIIEKKGAALIICGSVLFLICYSENIHLNVGVYAQVSENTSGNNSNGTSSANLTDIQNVTDSNTNNLIPYVLNATNSSDTTSQVANQVIQATSGGQSTSLEQVIDAASSALNNQSSNTTANNSSNVTSGLP